MRNEPEPGENPLLIRDLEQFSEEPMEAVQPEENEPADAPPVAVGIAVARYPRTDPYERISRIRLLPWMNGVKAHIRIRMHDVDAGNPPAHQSLHTLPVHVVPLASAAQGLPPVPGNPISEGLKPIPVAGNRVIVEVALHDRPQPLPRLRNRIVHALPQLLPDFLQLCARPLAYRLPFYGKAPRRPGPPA